MTITISVTSDDPSFAKVLADVTGTAPVSTSTTIFATAAGATLTDAAGAIWSFGPGNIILKGGSQFGGGVGTELGLFGGSIYAVGTGGVIYLAGASSWSVSAANPFTAAPPVIVPPAFTPSINGTTVPAPPQTDQVQTGFITDAAGNKFSLIYEKGAEFPYLYVNGVQIATANQLMIIDATVGPSAPVSANAVLYIWDLANLGKWSGGGWVTVTAIPANPNPDPPIMGIVASPASGGTSGGTTPPATTAKYAAMSPSLQAQMNATAAGGTLTLPAGSFSDTGKASVAMTILGNGTTIDMTGVSPVEGKACIVLSAAGCTVKNVTLLNEGTPDANSVGGIRDDGFGGIVDSCTIHGFDMGVGPTVAGPNPWVIQGAFNISGNGSPGLGDTHEVYIGTCPSLTINGTGAAVIGPSRDVHSVKSRALITTINTTALITGGMGSCLDQPDGGTVSATGGTWTINAAPTPAQQDTVFFHFGEESGANAGGAAVFNNIHFVIAAGLGGGIFINGTFLPNATITLNGCTWSGDAAPTFQGYAAANIIGTIAKA
jgi:hypothetical protein